MEGTVLETRLRGGFFALYVSLGRRRDVARSVSDALIFVYPHFPPRHLPTFNGLLSPPPSSTHPSPRDVSLFKQISEIRQPRGEASYVFPMRGNGGGEEINPSSFSPRRPAAPLIAFPSRLEKDVPALENTAFRKHGGRPNWPAKVSSAPIGRKRWKDEVGEMVFWRTTPLDSWNRFSNTNS